MQPASRGSMCAVRAFGAYCAEGGEAGVAWSRSSQPGAPPFKYAHPMAWCEGATIKGTVLHFKSMFGPDGLKVDKDQKGWKGAGQMLLQRSSDVKLALEDGCDCGQLHAKLSLHAINNNVLCGVAIQHSPTGPCRACEMHCPHEYAALQPKPVRRAGRPPKRKQQKRASSGTRVRSR